MTDIHSFLNDEQSAIFQDRTDRIEDKGFELSYTVHINLDGVIISIQKSGYSIETLITGLEIMNTKDFGSMIDQKFAMAIKQLIKKFEE